MALEPCSLSPVLCGLVRRETKVLHAYLNYPNARVSVHGTSCGHIQQARKQGQRRVFLNTTSIGTELRRFVERGYDFAAQAANNDMWLDLDFSDAAFELAIVKYILRRLGVRYKRFRDCEIEWHCGDKPI